MYASVTTVQIQSGKTEEAVRVFNDLVAPDFKPLKGFKSFFFLTDAKTGKAHNIILWETEADAVAGGAGAGGPGHDYQAHLAELARFLVGPTIREIYEVSLEG